MAEAQDHIHDTPHEASIAGKTECFYSVSPDTMFELRGLAKPLARALSILFTPIGQESGVKEQTFKRDGPDGHEEGTSVDVMPVDPKVVEMKLKQRADAIESVIEAAGEQKNRYALGRFILDSRRTPEERRAGKLVKDDEIKVLLSGKVCDAVAFGQMLQAALKANAGAFGALGGKMAALVEPAEAAVNAAGAETK